MCLSIGIISCNGEKAGPVAPALVHHTLNASLDEDQDEVKASLNPEDDSEVLWAAGEKVAVFVGDNRYPFTSTNESPASSAKFEGDAPQDLGTYIMLSPDNAAAVKSGGSVSSTLAVSQTGHAGSYAPGTIILAGKSDSGSIICRHVCSGVRFKTGRAGVTAVSLQGNNGEKIAGNFSFSFNGDVPVAGEGSKEIITLTAPGGGTFEADKWYYIVSLPHVFSKGVTLTAQAGSQIGTLVISTENLEFKRGVMKQVSSLNSRMTWVEPTVSNTCYGPSNTFCLKPGKSLKVDVWPRQIKDGWLRGETCFTGAPEADDYDFLWNTASVEAILSDQTLSLSAGASEGSALVVLKNGSTILWSFLVWVSNSGVENSALGGGNIFFQWGRKDPMAVIETDYLNPGDPPYIKSGCTLGTYPQGAVNSLVYSIQNPSVYIAPAPESNSDSDWFADSSDNRDDSLWNGAGGAKTVWDPCPEGWRVPSRSTITDLPSSDKWGYVGIEGNYLILYGAGDSYLWTREPFSNSAYCRQILGDTINNEYDMSRSLALPVRCVKE